MSSEYFSDLLPVLAERGKLAAVSRLGFANVPLRRHLNTTFDRPYGTAGAFLADPTFEAVFGWRQSDVSMADLAGNLLTRALVDAMANPATALAQEYTFPETQRPYTHQLGAWRILADPSPTSLVVASGTGSGKTECFMVPIIDSLLRQREAQQGPLVGVRALFLYPLNALINSQRDRLRAWTETFDGDIRFCLYNGNTPERGERIHDRGQRPSEVRDRRSLRASPPPILVTNATMLEYMLVRTVDAPILAQSQGKLEWVVLDEAHTYVGSQAAEAALLLRRVLLAFGVKPDRVRFVATSATIGDPEGEAGDRLRRFLAEVAGVPVAQVRLCAGERHVPTLDGHRAASTAARTVVAEIDPEYAVSSRRYEALAEHVTARQLRDLFVGDAGKQTVVRLSDVCRVVNGAARSYSVDEQIEGLRWLDLLSGTQDVGNRKIGPGEPFLPLRAHLFHQTLSGLWACADPGCSGRDATSLDDERWFFGQVYLDPRKHCECGSPVYELGVCGGCGSVHLQAGLDSAGRVTHFRPLDALDEFELDVEAADEVGDYLPGDDATDGDRADARSQQKLLICNHPGHGADAMFIARQTRQWCDESPGTLRVLATEDHGNGLSCPACSATERPGAQLFYSSRLGAPFLLGSILPTLLEYAPDGDKPAEHPCRGRRLLTFNDSRQGTARMAARLQLDAERNRVRGLVYHLCLQHGRAGAGPRSAALREEIQTLENAQQAQAAPHPGLDALIDSKRAELAAMDKPAPLAFDELACRLVGQGRDFQHMLDNYRNNAPATFGGASGPLELARMFLVREFGRRPKRLNNLESMGLVAIRYPALEALASVPSMVQDAAGLSLQDWRDFLKIALDFSVRAGGALEFFPSWRSWMGMPFPQRWLVERDEADVARRQTRWPRARRSGLRSTLVRLLAHALQADLASPRGQDRVDVVLQAAWQTLCERGLLRQTDDGRVLPLTQLAFAPMASAWICPVTRRFLDTTFRGHTPYLPEQATPGNAQCEAVLVPLYDAPFGDVTDDLERISRGREWLRAQEAIHELREQGLWSDLNDRTVELAPYFTTAEHSAQQDSRTLERYERQFKAGDLNLLSCSTTMEMGIDIGGISMVAMNNVPPHPANYLQRAGRAGRRQELRSLAMTLCKSNPHDQSAFSDSRWAFMTPMPAPRVSLDSPLIVQRHVNSLLLSHFFTAVLAGTGQEQTKLTSGFFFLGNEPAASGFVAWARAFAEPDSTHLAANLRELLRYTLFESERLEGIVDNSARDLEDVAEQWLTEWAHLESEEESLTASGDGESPATRAVALHKARLSGEYLLRELSARGFLPAYGFPTHIASFDNLTRERLQRERKRTDEGREDNRYRRRELPSRDLMTALREYAPGSEVVIDGLAYRSAGVTLNWHIPADQNEAREIQDIRLAWRCTHCGASGSTHSLTAAAHCAVCGEAVDSAHIREFLSPAGFAVDFFREPTNDVTTQHFVPVEAPWIDADADWFPLANPVLGRFRSTTRGHMFHQSRGVNGTGYALCLECGRAEPMSPTGERPEAMRQPHRRLRRSRDDAAQCPGSSDTWKIKESITLGHETWTDMFELQLKTEAGVWLNDRTTATSLAVALRDALAEQLGVLANELGCDAKRVKPEAGVTGVAISIFDRNAAGYASSAQRDLRGLFQVARRRLECPASCDSACPRCILDFDQRFAVDNLDRHAALRFLSDAWLDSLQLPQDLAFFGLSSRIESQRLSEAVWRSVGTHSVSRVMLYAGGDAAAWDVGPSPLRDLAYRLAGYGVEVEVRVPVKVLGSLEDSDRYLLASMADHPGMTVIELADVPRVGGGCLLAEALGKETSRWATGQAEALLFGPQWGEGKPLVVAIEAAPWAVEGAELTPDAIRPSVVDVGDREVEIHHEMDGELGGFGARFWDYVAAEHPPIKATLDNEQDDLLEVAYRDRYLFAPLSVALLGAIIGELKQRLGSNRWNVRHLEIATMGVRASGQNRSRNVIWADWNDTQTRDRVLEALFERQGIAVSLNVGDAASTGHGRLLELRWASGTSLAVRMDQGVSYWRASRANRRRAVEFDFFEPSIDHQAEQLASLLLDVEGSYLPTQLFLKTRTLEPISKSQ